MGIFDQMKKAHYRASGQANAIWELKNTSNVDFTKHPESEVSQISDQVVAILESITHKWGKEDFTLTFIMVCGSAFTNSKITTQLFHDAAMSYVLKNKSSFKSPVLEFSLLTLGRWAQIHQI